MRFINFFPAILLFVSASLVSAQDVENYKVSQTQKGTVSAGGYMSYSKQTMKVTMYSYTYEYEYTQFQFAPNIGYFFTDNFLTGISLNFVSLSGDFGKGSSNSFGPYIEYYAGDSANKPFFGLNFQFFSNSGSSVTQVGISAGYNLYLAKNISVQPRIDYRLSSREGGSFGDVTELAFGFTLRAFIF